MTMNPETILRAAQQIERNARHAELHGGEEGKAKASGYRHAIHVLHLMAGDEFPSLPAVSASLLPAGTLPGMAGAF